RTLPAAELGRGVAPDKRAARERQRYSVAAAGVARLEPRAERFHEARRRKDRRRTRALSMQGAACERGRQRSAERARSAEYAPMYEWRPRVRTHFLRPSRAPPPTSFGCSGSSRERLP